MSQSNKVYLNPKFNDLIKTNTNLQHKNVVHFNPLFAFQSKPLHQNAIVPNQRIYVNPNFIKTKDKQKLGSVPMKKNVAENCSTSINFRKEASSMPVNNNISQKNTIPSNNESNNDVSTPLLIASRYSLIRHNNKKKCPENILTTKSINTPSKLPDKRSCTIKINKFKSVKLEDLKKSFDTVTNNSAKLDTNFLCSRKNRKSNILESSVLNSKNIDNQKKLISTTKSRYRLVRCKNDKTVSQIQNKFLKNSAMSIPIRNTKKEFNIPNNRNKDNLKNISLKKISVCLTPQQKVVYKIHNRFRIVKENSKILCTSSNGKGKKLSLVSRKIQSSNIPVKINNSLAKFHTNNIPCPLFRKFGKCIRTINGNCKFLHDKRHVSVCRKYLKGICHEEDCPLSHDITSKKMPTCYYYLKGMCTKENCPYLHVKLNENTKICTDFAKGFCEKGENCSYRHINISSNLALKGICSSAKCSFPQKLYKKFEEQNSNKTGESCSFKLKKTKDLKEKPLNYNGQDDEEAISIKIHTQNYEEVDARYYKDTISDIANNEEFEVIKPTRAKLGTLPAFIQVKK